jgi:hypothetical protein
VPAAPEAAGAAVEELAVLQAARAPAVTPDMAAAAAIFRKPLREILFILRGSFLRVFFFFSILSHSSVRRQTFLHCRPHRSIII